MMPADQGTCRPSKQRRTAMHCLPQSKQNGKGVVQHQSNQRNSSPVLASNRGCMAQRVQRWPCKRRCIGRAGNVCRGWERKTWCMGDGGRVHCWECRYRIPLRKGRHAMMQGCTVVVCVLRAAGPKKMRGMGNPAKGQTGARRKEKKRQGGAWRVITCHARLSAKCCAALRHRPERRRKLG